MTKEIAPRLSGLAIYDRVRTGDELGALWLANKAELTRENYQQDLQSFADFVHASSVPEAISELLRCDSPQAHAVVLRYQAYLSEATITHGGETRTGYAPSTICRRIYALRSVVNLARELQIINWNLDQIRLPSPEPIRSTRGPGPDGYAAVLAAIDTAIASRTDRNRFLALRDRVMMRLLHDSGLRRFEVVKIEFPRGVRLDDESSVLVLGKGRRRHQWVPISAPCAEAIRSYLEVRGQRAGYLLCGVGRRGRRGMARSTVNRRAHHWAAKAGVDFTPHGLRHTAITTVLDAVDGDLRLAARWSRHLSLASLRPYDDRRRADDRRLTELISDPSKAEPHE